MENLSQNGLLKGQTQMNFQSSPICEIQKEYKEGGSSSGVNSCNKPPVPSFKTSPLVDGTHVLPIDNQIRRIQAAASTTQASIGRISLMTDQQLIEYEQKNGRNIDPENVDIKKLKRTIANRLSAQKSRLKKCQKIEEMEKNVRELEETIHATKTQIESTRKTKEMLRVQNIMMKQKLDYISKKIILTNIEIGKNNGEARWLRGYRQIVKQNAMYAEKKKMDYQQLVPNTQIHQPFNIHPIREHPNLGEVSGKFSNMEDTINYQPTTNSAN